MASPVHLRFKHCWMKDTLHQSWSWPNWKPIGSICYKISLTILLGWLRKPHCQLLCTATWTLIQFRVLFSRCLFKNWGDEGQAFQGNYMVFHWQCDLAPKLGDSMASRFLITTVPSSGYVFDNDVNVTLQCVAQHIANTLTGLKVSIPSLNGDSATWLLLTLISSVFSLWLSPQKFSPVWWITGPCTMAAGHGLWCICDGLQRGLEVYSATLQLGAPCILWGGMELWKTKHKL